MVMYDYISDYNMLTALTMWHHDADRFLRLLDVVGGQTAVRVAAHELLPFVVPGHRPQSLQ